MRPTAAKPTQGPRRTAIWLFTLRWLALAVIVGVVVGLVLKLT